jgi:protease-4
MLIRILLLVVLLAGGCTRMRFVVEAVPAEDELTETEVYRDEGAKRSDGKIVIVDVTGLIIDQDRPGLLRPGENPVSRFAESLRKAADDSRVRGLLVRINSPGGGVTATDVMYRELLRYKEKTGRPVVILMADVAASGGYYLACGGDEIVAHPTTITGSIGVIVQTFNFSEGMHKIGIKADAITSGPNKAMGSPFEPMSPEQRALLQGLVDEFYASFLGVVEKRRPQLAAEDMKWILDGRVITGRQAAEVGAIDRVGDLDTAYEAVKARAGIARARLVKYHRPIEYVGSAYSTAPAAGTQVNLLQLNLAGLDLDQPGFYYLWDPLVW